MAYTPINWQTGDTITAEKLNRCDNGWGYENTQLFSETVTTTDTGQGYSAGSIAYHELINAASIEVTFDGTDYTCPRIDFNGTYFYGGFSTDPAGPDFTDFPFFINSSTVDNMLLTETAGTHAISATGDAIVTSSDFRSAVLSVGAPPMQCVSGITTYDEMDMAKLSNRLMYFYDSDGRCAIVANMTTSPITITPSMPDITVDFDYDNIFTVSYA